ncbi:MAG: MBL fold metallo-hydrolase [Lachnospiraceae bacterium]|nr:MBL fold metallo-hydrolase [Lachnospiraceae bacterium]
MKLVTLGTSHGDPTALRFCSSNALEINGDVYIIDAGAPIDALYIRKYTNDFSKVRAIFITHMHDDHIGGLPGFIKELVKYAKEGQHTHIYLPENVEQVLCAWLRAMHVNKIDRFITFHVIRVGEIYKDKNVCVSAVGTNHIPSDADPLTFAFFFKAKGKTLFYSGDLACDFSDFPLDDLKKNGADLCVCECTHYDPYVALEVFEQLPIKKMLFNHVGNRNATEEGANRWKEVFKKCNFTCTIAHDGDEYYV